MYKVFTLVKVPMYKHYDRINDSWLPTSQGVEQSVGLPTICDALTLIWRHFSELLCISYHVEHNSIYFYDRVCFNSGIGPIPYKPDAGPKETLVFKHYNASEVGDNNTFSLTYALNKVFHLL